MKSSVRRRQVSSLVRDVIMATDMGRHASFCAATAAALGGLGGAPEGGGSGPATAAAPAPAVGGGALLHMQLLLKCAYKFFCLSPFPLLF